MLITSFPSVFKVHVWTFLSLIIIAAVFILVLVLRLMFGHDHSEPDVSNVKSARENLKMDKNSLPARRCATILEIL